MRIDKRLLLLLCIVPAILQSCTQELKLPDNGTTKKILMTGELVAGDTFNIRGGLSIPVVLGSSMTYGLPTNMQITLTGDGNTKTITGMHDAYADSLHTLAFGVPLRLKPEIQYTLTATQDGIGSASCAVTIPAPFLASILDTATVTVSNLI